MQCADIFFLRADICQLGMDQRKVGKYRVFFFFFFLLVFLFPVFDWW